MMQRSERPVSPFLAESGICWMLLVDLDLEPEFAESLLSSTDSVVVSDRGSRSQSAAETRTGRRVVRRYYEPAAQVRSVFRGLDQKATGGKCGQSATERSLGDSAKLTADTGTNLPGS